MKKHVEVRCCCVPQNLLGWIELDESMISFGARLIIPMKAPHPLALPASNLEPPKRFPVVELMIDTYNERGQSWLAIKSNEHPIEVFREIPGFIENTHGGRHV